MILIRNNNKLGNLFKLWTLANNIWYDNVFKLFKNKNIYL